MGKTVAQGIKGGKERRRKRVMKGKGKSKTTMKERWGGKSE